MYSAVEGSARCDTGRGRADDRGRGSAADEWGREGIRGTRARHGRPAAARCTAAGTAPVSGTVPVTEPVAAPVACGRDGTERARGRASGPGAVAGGSCRCPTGRAAATGRTVPEEGRHRGRRRASGWRGGWNAVPGRCPGAGREKRCRRPWRTNRMTPERCHLRRRTETPDLPVRRPPVRRPALRHLPPVRGLLVGRPPAARLLTLRRAALRSGTAPTPARAHTRGRFQRAVGAEARGSGPSWSKISITSSSGPGSGSSSLAAAKALRAPWPYGTAPAGPAAAEWPRPATAARGRPGEPRASRVRRSTG